MRLSKSPAAPQWTVRVAPAKKQTFDDYYDEHYHAKNDEGNGDIAVRLRLDGKDRMTFGVLHIADPEFEDKITTMKAAAEERAAALMAVEATEA